MINTVEDLINELLKFPKDHKIRFIHEGNQTYGPYLYDVREMFETTKDVSRGEVDENVSHDQDATFTEPVAVIRGGW